MKYVPFTVNSAFGLLVDFLWYRQNKRQFVCHVSQKTFYGEFDPGSGRTLAACLTHASRAMKLLR